MLKEDEGKYIIDTYNRRPEATPLLVRGSGTKVWDEEGKEYLDFVGGLAVNALGHCHPRVVEAAKRQLDNLVHASNLYYTEAQVTLARYLVENSCTDKVFFSNSGAEANEAAIKVARKYAQEQVDPQRYEIITAYNSFHGRTLATLSATGQEKFHKGFGPLPHGFKYAYFNDVESFREQVSEKTCAVMVEPVQGEGGVYTATREFLRDLRDLCNERNLLLIFDEVQCGMGRTGRLFAYGYYGVEPDIITLAKALGGGLPLGAMLCREKVASSFAPGTHASTFGGNPVVCAAAVKVIEEMLSKGFLSSVEEKGSYFADKLLSLKEKFPGVIKEIRGAGLILGMEIASGAQEIQKICREQGLLINALGDSIIRFLPPLNTAQEEIDKALSILTEAFNRYSAC